MNNKVGPAVAAWTDFFERYDMEKYGSEGAPLHDPCVIGYMINPALFTGRWINVEIETDSPLTVGATVADWWNVTGRKANAEFYVALTEMPSFNYCQSDWRLTRN